MESEILDTRDALAISTFMDIGKEVDKQGDLDRAELYYKRALRAAETIFGAYHGETGLVLLKLANFYRRYGRYEEAMSIQDRIAAITAIYLYDQCC
jgi:tetratricopeptide (TPR) repeat protein